MYPVLWPNAVTQFTYYISGVSPFTVQLVRNTPSPSPVPMAAADPTEQVIHNLRLQLL